MRVTYLNVLLCSMLLMTRSHHSEDGKPQSAKALDKDDEYVSPYTGRSPLLATSKVRTVMRLGQTRADLGRLTLTLCSVADRAV
jgi:hypothetical protein